MAFAIHQSNIDRPSAPAVERRDAERTEPESKGLLAGWFDDRFQQRVLAGAMTGALILTGAFRGSIARAQQPRAAERPAAVEVQPPLGGFTVYGEKEAASDARLARVFGGSGAVAAANAWEPDGMSGATGVNRYRGRLNNSHPGHLDNKMHLYGSNDGTGTTEIYVPDGFRYLGKIDAANAGHVFYYPRLGRLRNVTLEIFHVKDFAIRRGEKNEAGSIRIGTIGGDGGAPYPGTTPMRNGKYAPYIHAHMALRSGRGHAGRLVPLPAAFPNDAAVTPAPVPAARAVR